MLPTRSLEGRRWCWRKMELIRLGGAARLARAEAVWQIGEHEGQAQRLPRLVLPEQPNRGNLSWTSDLLNPSIPRAGLSTGRQQATRVLWTSTGGQGSVDDHRLAIVHIVRVWLRTALQARDLSAEVWAHRAGVAPKVLTDCLAQDSYVPNMRVLTKLAEAADLPLPDLEQPTPLRLIKGDRADA